SGRALRERVERQAGPGMESRIAVPRIRCGGFAAGGLRFVKKSTFVAMALLIAMTTACSFQNSYEKKAQRVTEALIANDMTPVKDEIPAGVTRVQVAEYSAELSGYGKLKSVKEDPAGCPSGMHCFDAQFENRL